MNKYLISLLLTTASLNAFALIEKSKKLVLSEIETSALSSSHRALAINAEIDAARNKVNSLNSLNYPKLSLEANYRYLDEVPSLSFPGGAKTAFGDHHNYSIGPILTWTMLDFGATKKSIKSAKALESSKLAQRDLTTREILLSARMAYFKVQLRQEQLRLVQKSLKLAESQHRDIKNRVTSGSSTRIDLLFAHKEVLKFKLQARQIKADLTGDLRDLYVAAGINEEIDSTVFFTLDSISSSLNDFYKYENSNISKANLDQHPLIKMHASNAESMRISAESSKSNKLPKISLFAKSSLDYPNGPILEKFNQNTIGVNFTMPIFENGKSTNEALEKESLALASDNYREQARINLYRDWQKNQDQLRALKDKIDIFKSAIKEANEQSELTYSSYRFGRSSFLEVQSSNLHALEVNVQATTNDIQILIQLANLACISEDFQ